MIIRPYVRRWSVWCLGWLSHLGSGLAMGFVLWGGRIALRCQRTAGLVTQLFRLLFRVLGALCARLRAGSDSPGDTSGANAGEESGL